MRAIVAHWPGAWLLLTLGCGCGDVHAPDGGFDAGVDARDAEVDAPVDAGAIVLEPGPAFGRACAPWSGLPDVLARGLPADSTPRRLWRWSPSDDPRWTTLGGGDPNLASLTRSPSGRFMVLTSGRSMRVATLSGAGELLALTAPAGPVRSPIVALPDGRAAIVVNDVPDGEIEGTTLLATVTPDGALEAARVAGGRARVDAPTDPVSLAVGPEGRLYFAAQNWIAATCQGSELVWRLILPAEVRLVELIVDPGGNLWAADGNPRGGAPALRVAPNGDTEWSPAPSPATPSAEVRTGWFGDTRLVTAGVDDTAWAFVVNGAAVEWSAPLDVAPVGGRVAQFDGTAGVWLTNAVAGRLVRLTRAGTAFDVPAIAYPLVTGVLEDGSLLRMLDLGPPHVGLEDPATGLERWRVAFDDPDSVGNMLHPPAIGPDGVAVLSTGTAVFAIQLDRLPPLEPACFGATCGNSRMDGAAVRFLR